MQQPEGDEAREKLQKDKKEPNFGKFQWQEPLPSEEWVQRPAEAPSNQNYSGWRMLQAQGAWCGRAGDDRSLPCPRRGVGASR